MTEIGQKPHSLIFIYPDKFPQDLIDDDLNEILDSGLNIQVEKRENGAFSAFEWVVPTVFIAYILKPYIGSFLSEAGKDHYALLKTTLSKLLKRARKSQGILVTAKQSTAKPSNTYSQSLIVSCNFQTVNNRRIILLFDNNLSLEEWQNAIDQMLELLENNFTSYPHDILTLEIAKLNTKNHRMIYAIINVDTKKLEFMDDTKMIQKFK